jgi:SanA protein
MKTLIIILLIIAAVTLIAAVAINLWVMSFADGKVYQDVESVPVDLERTAIVLGARIDEDGTPSNTLHDRTLVGVELYKAGRTAKLLLSGGGGEPASMKALAISLGVPENDLIIDEFGLRTYESCKRARDTYGITRAIIVTQDYHLPRSLYLCQNLGIDATAINAKRREYLGERYAHAREYASRILAFRDINF